MNLELSKKNFERAGEVLAEIWSEIEIDSHPVIAEYIKPEKSSLDEQDLMIKDELWVSRHVQTSQYFLQIVKCDNVKCCGQMRSSLKDVLKSQFIPPPMPVEKTTSLKFSIGSESQSKFAPLLLTILLKDLMPKQHKKVPYDTFCPSVKDVIEKRMCQSCHLYFASANLLQTHKQIHKNCSVQVKSSKAAALKSTEYPKIRPVRIAAARGREKLIQIAHLEEYVDMCWLQDDELDLENLELPSHPPEKAPIINLCESDHFASPWTEI